MFLLLFSIACGEKSEDTGVVDANDTAESSVEEAGASEDTGSTEGGESTNDSGETGDTGETDQGQLWSSDALSELTSGGGCGDYFLYAHNATDMLALQVSGSGLAMEAHQSPRGVAEYTYTINPMTDDIQPLIVAQEGAYLNAWSCNDAAINEPQLDAEYSAISGTVHVTVVAEGEMTDWGEVPANITVEMTDVCFDAPEAFCIESHTMVEFIGWMPG